MNESLIESLEATKYGENELRFASDHAQRIFRSRNKGVEDCIGIARSAAEALVKELAACRVEVGHLAATIPAVDAHNAAFDKAIELVRTRLGGDNGK